MIKCLIPKINIVLSKEQKNRGLSIILERSLSFLNSEINPDGTLKIVILSRQEKIYRELFTQNNIKAQFSDTYGAFSAFERLRGRFGLLIGCIILLLSVYISSKFVWKIEFQGNNSISNKELLDELEKSGFKIGAFIPSIDYDALHNKILMNSEKISWISINIDGNVAKVKLTENKHYEKENSILYTNVVSKCDAQIAEIRVINGTKTIKPLDIVKKGDILISGIIDSKAQGVRYVNADGEILGYTEKKISITVPYKDYQKQYTGERYVDSIYKIFNFKIKISAKYRNSYMFYDTIEKTDKLKLFKYSLQPFEKHSVIYLPYENLPITRTPEEATDLALAQLRSRLDEELINAELIKRSISTKSDNDGVTITCTLYCLESIGIQYPYYVETKG